MDFISFVNHKAFESDKRRALILLGQEMALTQQYNQQLLQLNQQYHQQKAFCGGDTWVCLLWDLLIQAKKIERHKKKAQKHSKTCLAFDGLFFYFGFCLPWDFDMGIFGVFDMGIWLVPSHTYFLQLPTLFGKDYVFVPVDYTICLILGFKPPTRGWFVLLVAQQTLKHMKKQTTRKTKQRNINKKYELFQDKKYTTTIVLYPPKPKEFCFFAFFLWRPP